MAGVVIFSDCEMRNTPRTEAFGTNMLGDRRSIVFYVGTLALERERGGAGVRVPRTTSRVVISSRVGKFKGIMGI